MGNREVASRSVSTRLSNVIPGGSGKHGSDTVLKKMTDSQLISLVFGLSGRHDCYLTLNPFSVTVLNLVTNPNGD